MPAGKEYRGRLSKGCNSCRSKRVKCDEGKPKCEKCIKSGLNCNYRDLFQITFRDENPKAAERAQKTWRARVKTKPDTSLRDDDSASSDSSSDRSELARVLTPLPTAPLKLDVVDCAINRFFFDYVLPEGRPGHHLSGIFDYIPSLFYESPPNCSFREAILAVSLANYDRRTGCSIRGIRHEIDQHYGNALRLVAEEARNPKKAQGNSLLLAVQMLGIYEQMSTGGNNPVFLQAHAMGMAGLLKARGQPIIRSTYDWRIFRSMDVHMLAVGMKLGVASFIPYSLLKPIYEESGYPMARLLGLIHQGVDLLALWKDAEASRNQNEKDLLLEKISVLESDLADWETTLPRPAWFMSRSAPNASILPKWLRHIVEHPGMPKVIHEYDSVQIIYIWSLYRMLRIQVARVLLIASLRDPSTLRSIKHHQDVILRMIEDSCSSILPSFTQAIDTKPHAENASDVVGFRPIMAILPLNVTKAAIMLVPQNDETDARRAWIEMLTDFVTSTFHNKRPVVMAGEDYSVS